MFLASERTFNSQFNAEKPPIGKRWHNLVWNDKNKLKYGENMWNTDYSTDRNVEERYGGGEEHTTQQQFRGKVVMYMLLNVSDLYSTTFLPSFDLFFTGHLQILIHALTNKQTICTFCSCILFYKGQFATELSVLPHFVSM